MSEKPPQEMPKSSEERSDSIHFTRHSKADYKTYRKIRSSENPQGEIDYENQITPDLSEEGVALAELKAGELLSEFNPDEDILFFASSNEARSLETANIYRNIAQKKGFEILKPQKAGLKLAERIGDGEIRVIHNLSLNNKDLLLQSLFNPDYQNQSANWDELDPETRKKCDEVRAMIKEHDYGSFGANFFHYSEKAQKVFPQIKSAKNLFDRQFHNLLRLAEFGVQKARESGLKKNVKILAFGHENYMGYALDKYFQEHDIKNCETIDVNVATSGTELTKQGTTQLLE
ncbi:hypothetical protein HY627_01200 [Candidatus Uhrbacteria bacterium]|nr:hypothetical protein [Candidatus Uhrbacteria bacterium]